MTPEVYVVGIHGDRETEHRIIGIFTDFKSAAECKSKYLGASSYLYKITLGKIYTQNDWDKMDDIMTVEEKQYW